MNSQLQNIFNFPWSKQTIEVLKKQYVGSEYNCIKRSVVIYPSVESDCYLDNIKSKLILLIVFALQYYINTLLYVWHLHFKLFAAHPNTHATFTLARADEYIGPISERICCRREMMELSDAQTVVRILS